MEAIFTFLVTAFFFAVVPAIVVLAFVLSYVMKQQQAKAWGELARQTGLMLRPGSWTRPPAVTGGYKGFNVYLYTYTQGSGKHKVTYTSMVVYLPFMNRAHVRVTREGFLSSITKAFGSQDIHIGDPAFDGAYVIKSDTPEYVRDLLTPEIRGMMLGGNPDINFTVARGTVFHNRQGIEKNTALLRYILDLLAAIAARIVEIEIPAHAQPPQQQAPPEPAFLPPPVTVCSNCGAELKWQADQTGGTAVCEYCGHETKFQLARAGLRRR
jgi:hypothetical protein